MSIPSGWLPSPSGAGSAQSAALLPVPAIGSYIEPFDAPDPVPTLPDSIVATGEVNGNGSVAGNTDHATASRVLVTRRSVYGVVLLDSCVTADAGGPEQCPRPVGNVITACPRLPA